MTDILPTITVYTRRFCGYCGAAKQLLESHDYQYAEVSLDNDPEQLEQVMLKANQRTMPQIFVADRSVGGFRELYQQINSGEFAELVASLTQPQ
jgi:glutaredoxin 3